MSEFRFNILKNRWVLLDGERSNRKGYFNIESVEDVESKSECPFCPGMENCTPVELYRKNNSEGEWERRVIPNKYPVLKVEEYLFKNQMGPYSRVAGTGVHEIIIESKEHFLKLSEHSKLILYDTFDIFRTRVDELKKDVRLKYFSLFKNYGYSGGATLLHPHSQILGIPFVPSMPMTMLSKQKSYYLEHDRCIVCDIIDYEMAADERIIYSNEDFLAVIPYASEYPFEVHVYPLRHQSDFFDKDTNLLNLADIVNKVFVMLEKKLNNPPLNMGLYIAPVDGYVPFFGHFKASNSSFHWHLEIIPRLNRTGGVEVINDMMINPVLPEKAAKVLEG